MVITLGGSAKPIAASAARHAFAAFVPAALSGSPTMMNARKTSGKLDLNLYSARASSPR